MSNALQRTIRALAVVTIAVLAVLPTGSARAGVERWTAMGPDGANVLALAVSPSDPSIAYAGTMRAGVLSSTDGAASWTPLGTLAGENVWSLVVDPVTPTTLYAGTDSGVFKSIDAGRHWANGSTGLAGNVHALAIDGRTPAILYAATEGGLFKSSDGAATWSALTTGLAGLTPRVVTIDPRDSSRLYIGADFYADDSLYGAFRSTDAGATWTRIYTTPPFGDGGAYSVIGIAVDPADSSRLYMIGDGVLRSVDGGSTWSHASLPRGTDALYSLAIDRSNGSVYAGTYFGQLARSTDGGDHWSLVPNPPKAAGFNAIVPTPAGILVGARNGLFRGTSDAQSWVQVRLGVRRIGAGQIAIDPAAPSVVYADAGGAFARTTDGGSTWVYPAQAPRADESMLLAADPAVPSVVYMGTFSSLYRSADAGDTWTLLTSGWFGLRSLVIAPSQTSTLYAGVNSGGVFKSTNSGTSWSRVNNGIHAVGGPYISALAVDPTTPEIVYAATSPTGNPDTNAKLFKSVDGAASWNQVAGDVAPGAEIRWLAVDPVTPSTLYAAYDNFGNPAVSGVLRSVDGGQTWGAATAGLPAAWIWVLAIDPALPSRIYAATSGGVYASVNRGMTWNPINAGLDASSAYDLAVDRSGKLLRVATDRGIFEYQVGTTAAKLVVVEYWHAAFDHYFITSLPDEIDKLDRGVFEGWARTGYQFNANAPGAVPGSPVCRFFSTTFGAKSSHFFTPFPDECSGLTFNPNWVLETIEAFDLVLFDGPCPVGYTPLHRLYNNGQGGAPNHRYTTDPAIRDRMIAQGWVWEYGFGPDGTGTVCSAS